ncbi:fetuin-B-like [Hyla sarda]|uniref:fetuin-B-like n=1 Tax=Hyla sarda TaxID=327740 RepID=UPI0024C23E3D|nr:fetuin-B-like [Hyla sarda]XP_056421291.1 fetuin-B-like [Hyla sarda]
MKVTILLLISTQVFLATAGPSRGGKEPVLTSIACNDQAADSATDLSLRQLNANRREGFVLGLKRISNVQEQYDEENGSIFYLTLDVLETNCHVLSRRFWKDCEAKPRHEAVFGQCKVIFQLNKSKRIAHLHNYDCTLSPAARLPFGCPGCHFSQPLNDTSFQEVAKKSLEKFNKESNYNKYFSLGNITKAAQQVVAGKAYHVEFTIVESTCNKSADDFSLCEALDCEFAHTGYCKSMAVAHWSSPDDKKVQKVTCDVFEPEAAVVEEQKHKEGHAGDQPSSDNKDHGKKGDRGGGKKHGHKHGHAKHGNKHSRKHNHKHDHNHDSGSHEHEHDHEHEHLHDYEHHHGQPQRPHGPPSDAPKTVGTITYLSGNVAPTTASPADAAKKGKGPKPDKKEQRKPSKSFIRPFPEKASTSDQCPGPVKNIPFTENVPAVEVTQEPTPLPK